MKVENRPAEIAIAAICAPAKRRVAEHAERDHRGARGGLDGDERAQQADGGRERGDDVARAPAVLGRVEQAVDEREQAGHERDLARDVDLRRLRVTRLDELGHADREHGDADRHVDQEHPFPAEPLGERSTDERAEREGRADRGAVGGERARALLRRAERVAEQRERDGEHQRGAEALDRTRGDQELDRARSRRGGRGDGEDGHADPEQPAAAVAVGERARGQHDARQRERVGVQDPLERVQVRVQVDLQRRQRGVHHRDVEHENRGGGEDRGERPPLDDARRRGIRRGHPHTVRGGD